MGTDREEIGGGLSWSRGRCSEETPRAAENRLGEKWVCLSRAPDGGRDVQLRMNFDSHKARFLGSFSCTPHQPEEP